MENTLFNKSILRTWDLSDNDIKTIISTADKLKELRANNISPKIFDSGMGVSVFGKKDPSMELAFVSGCNLLGLQGVTAERNPGAGAIAETSANTSYMADALGICESDYLEKSSRYIKRISDGVEESAEKGIIPEKPAVINLGSDEDSPVETLAMLQYMAEKAGGLENLKGKKIAITWVYSPNGTRGFAVPQGLLSLVTRFGMNVTLAAPEGMDFMPDTYTRAAENAEKSGGSFGRTDKIDEAALGADIVVPMNWAPLSFLEKRTELSANNMGTYIDLLEHELRETNMEYIDWEITEELMEKTNSAVLLHSLPADVTDVNCIRGEMTAQVYNANLDCMLAKAGLRPYVIAAAVLLAKSENPEEILSAISEKAVKRHF